MVNLLADVLASVPRFISKLMNMSLEGCLGPVAIAIDPGAVEGLAALDDVGIIPMSLLGTGPIARRRQRVSLTSPGCRTSCPPSYQPSRTWTRRPSCW